MIINLFERKYTCVSSNMDELALQKRQKLPMLPILTNPSASDLKATSPPCGIPLTIQPHRQVKVDFLSLVLIFCFHNFT